MKQKSTLFCRRHLYRIPGTALLALLFLVSSSFTVRAALQPGDIAILGMNTDGTDEFAILTLKDIPGGEVIWFTDAGWIPSQSTFWVGESHHSWTVQPQGLPAGTSLTLTYPGSFSNTGDQLIAYQGNQGNPTFIAALNNSGNGGWQSTAYNYATSALPPGLIDGFTAVAVPQAKSINYNCVRTTGLSSDLLADIYQTENWLRHDASDFSLGTCNFQVTSPNSINLTLRGQKRVDENGPGLELTVYSNRTGSHSASVAYAGGTANAGSDFTFTAPIQVTFNASRKATLTIPLVNDNDCEGFETAQFFLMNLNGATSSGQSVTVLIDDDEDQNVEAYQGFEGNSADNWNYTINPSAYNAETIGDGQIVYGGKAVWEVIKDFNTVYNTVVGQQFFGMAFLTSSNHHQIDFAPINVTDMNGGTLTFKYITFNLASLDKIEYSVALDNGTQWFNYTPLNKNNETWEEVSIPIPSGVDFVRLRVRTQQVNGVVCAGLDDVHLIGSKCVAAPSVITGTIPALPCLNGNTPIQVPFSTTGSFQSGNVFTAYLSDAQGSFANATAIGSLALSGNAPSGSIAATLPGNLPSGTGYRIRVDASNPATTGTDNGLNLAIRHLDITLSSPTFAGGHNISCPGANDGSIVLAIGQGTAPYSYAWTGPNGFSSTLQNPTNLGPGTYQVVVNDGGGCTANASITLTEPLLDVVLLASDITCAGAQDGSISLTVNGSAPPFQIAWTGPNGYSSSAANLGNLSGGTYAYTVTDQNGCTVSGSTTITEPAALTSSISSPQGACGHQISCFGAQDGSIDLSVSGGTAPFSYSWTGPSGYTSSVEDPSNLGPGTYSVVVTDQNGCTTTQSINLTEPNPIDAVFIRSQHNCGFQISCNGASDGTGEVTAVSGGCPPYTYQWSNGQTTALATGLGAGPQSVTITDAQGCTLVRTEMYNEPAAIQVTANITPATCVSASNGAIDISVTGGCPPYTYTWTGPAGFNSGAQDISGLYPGNYSLSLTDANGCTATLADSVTIFNDLSASLGCCQDTSICEGDSIQLQIELTGSGPWSLTWTDGSQTYIDFVTFSPYTITVAPTSTTTYELVSMAQDVTDCPGEVCGSATVAVNDCQSEPCADLCVNTGVLSHFDQGNCRTVTLEVACDTACNSKTVVKTGGQCTGTQIFNFNTDPQGNPLPAGTIAGQQWASMGITISVINNNASHPQFGVIFDSSNPSGGDVDLGTPHQDFGGPGIGAGGALGQPGENSTARGNLLVIAENAIDLNNDGLIDDPDDEAAGGEMRIDFAGPYYLESVTMVDLDNGNGFIRVVQYNGDSTDFNIPGLGDNAVTDVFIGLDSVQSARVILPGSGGIAALAYCPVDSQAAFMDISIPCGTLSSFSNSLNLPMELVVQDPVTGITGLRVHGLPALCLDSAGIGPFTVTYEVCDAACAGPFCAPLVAYNRNGCVQYETAVMGSVLPPPPQTNSRAPMEADGLVEIYPNPVMNEATIRLTCVHDAGVTLELYDLTGSRRIKLWEGPLLSMQERTISFNTGDLPAGVYFLRMSTDKESSYVRKFIVLD